MGKVLIVRLKESGSRTLEYKNEVNAEDFRQIALILLDLDSNGLKIDKALQEFRKIRDKGEFPF